MGCLEVSCCSITTHPFEQLMPALYLSQKHAENYRSVYNLNRLSDNYRSVNLRGNTQSNEFTERAL